MAVIENERDKILQSAPQRVVIVPIPADRIEGLPDALDNINSLKSLRISASGSVVKVDGYGNHTPATITLTANLNIIEGAVTWDVTSGSASLSADTGPSVTIPASSINVGVATVRARVTHKGQTYTSIISLYKFEADKLTQSRVMELIKGQIERSDLHTALGAEIDLLHNNVPGSVNARLNDARTKLQSQLDTVSAEVADIIGAGEYDSATAYAAGALVKYNNKLYRAKQSTVGTLPTNQTHWELIGDYASLGAAVAAHAMQLSEHNTKINDNAGAISSEATQRSLLAVQMRGNYAGTNPLQVSSGLVYNIHQASVDRDGSLASRASAIEARMPSGNGQLASQANLTSVQQTLANQIGAEASRIDGVQAKLQTVGGENLLLNSDFEDGTAAWKVFGNSGTHKFNTIAGVWGTGKVAEIKTVGMHEINETVLSTITLVEIKKGAPLSLSAIVRGDYGTKLRLLIAFYDASNTRTDRRSGYFNVHGWGTSSSPSAQYVSFSLDASEIPDGTVKCEPMLIFSNGKTMHTERGWQVDRVKLERSSIATGWTDNTSEIRSAIQTTQQTLATFEGHVSAKYAVNMNLQSDGSYVHGGYGLIGTAGGGNPPKITAGFRVNEFWIAPPEGRPIGEKKQMFAYYATPTQVGSETVQGLYVDAANIVNLASKYASIQQLVAQTVQATSINADKLTLGNGTVGGNLRSNGGNTSTGWLLERNGNFYAANATIRGNIQATSGTIGGWNITSNGISSPNFVAGSQGARLTSQGLEVWQNGVIDTNNIAAKASTDIITIYDNSAQYTGIYVDASPASLTGVSFLPGISMPSGASGGEIHFWFSLKGSKAAMLQCYINFISGGARHGLLIEVQEYYKTFHYVYVGDIPSGTQARLQVRGVDLPDGSWSIPGGSMAIAYAGVKGVVVVHKR